MTIKLEIEGMSCGHCVRAVKQALEGVAGVESAKVDLARGSAEVDANDVSVEVLVAAIEQEGYRAKVA